MPEISISETKGHVDDKRRPLVRLFFYGAGEEYLALLDTGCSLTVVADDVFVAECNLTWDGSIEFATIASGESCRFKEYKAAVQWLGEKRVISVFVPVPANEARAPGLQSVRQRTRPFVDGAPRILLGIGLLEGTITSIDFTTNKITIVRA